jgi:hypothetical protein
MVARRIFSAGALCLGLFVCASGQSPRVDNPEAEKILLGKYDPAAYAPKGWVAQKLPYAGYPGEVTAALAAQVSPDSLLRILVHLAACHNRNAGSDTASQSSGIGAARRWVHARFAAIAPGRLIPAYLDFNTAICNVAFHRCVLAVLPGADTSDKAVVIVEAHLDSRCENSCDITCRAEGVEDNATGVAMLLELSRVLSAKAFNRTIVFMATTGEEQGLHGARAFATYATAKGIRIRAVQNNDVIGGNLCGRTSSPPGCSPPGAVDSTHLRIFSFGDGASPDKAFARFLKLEYLEKAAPSAEVPMGIALMLSEDRQGRGGDHQPFRAAGFTAIRLIQANEAGDQQHTTKDTLGPNIDVHYLKRMVLVNGLGAAMAALGPAAPAFTAEGGDTAVTVRVPGAGPRALFRLGVRTTSLDFDTVLTFAGPEFRVPGLQRGTAYSLSVAARDEAGVESLFAPEQTVTAKGTAVRRMAAAPDWRMEVAPEEEIGGNMLVTVFSKLPAKDAYLSVRDLNWRERGRLPLRASPGGMGAEIRKGRFPAGAYTVCLMSEGRLAARARAVLP